MPEDDEPDGNLHLSALPGVGKSDATGPVAKFRFDGDGWTATGIVSRNPQGLVISHLEIDPDTDGAGITIPMLRAVPVRDILAEARWLHTLASRHPSRAQMNTDAEMPTFADPSSPRPPITDEFLRRVALDYLEETAPGMPRGAIERLTKRYGKSTPTVSRWVGKAREVGWLGPAVSGRVGGEPGPRMLRGRSHSQRGVGGHPRPHEVKADEAEAGE